MRTIPFLLLLIPGVLSGQPDSIRTRGIFCVSYNTKFGIGNISFQSFKIKNQHRVHDVQFGYLRPIGPKVHLGLGVGIAGFHNPVRNTLPVELKVRYAPLEQRKLLSLDWDVGYAISLDKIFREGFTSSIGASVFPRITRRRRLGLQLGYTLQEIKNAKLILFSPGSVMTFFDNTIAHLIYVGIIYKT